jgi:hypothetical protein
MLFSRKRKRLAFRCIDRKEGLYVHAPRGGPTLRTTTQPKKKRPYSRGEEGEHPGLLRPPIAAPQS